MHALLRPGGAFVFNAPNFDASKASAYTHTRRSEYSSGGFDVRVVESNVLDGRALVHAQQATLRSNRENGLPCIDRCARAELRCAAGLVARVCGDGRACVRRFDRFVRIA